MPTTVVQLDTSRLQNQQAQKAATERQQQMLVKEQGAALIDKYGALGLATINPQMLQGYAKALGNPGMFNSLIWQASTLRNMNAEIGKAEARGEDANPLRQKMQQTFQQLGQSSGMSPDQLRNFSTIHFPGEETRIEETPQDSIAQDAPTVTPEAAPVSYTPQFAQRAQQVIPIKTPAQVSDGSDRYAKIVSELVSKYYLPSSKPTTPTVAGAAAEQFIDGRRTDAQAIAFLKSQLPGLDTAFYESARTDAVQMAQQIKTASASTPTDFPGAQVAVTNTASGQPMSAAQAKELLAKDKNKAAAVQLGEANYTKATQAAQEKEAAAGRLAAQADYNKRREYAINGIKAQNLDPTTAQARMTMWDRANPSPAATPQKTKVSTSPTATTLEAPKVAAPTAGTPEWALDNDQKVIYGKEVETYGKPAVDAVLKGEFTFNRDKDGKWSATPSAAGRGSDPKAVEYAQKLTDDLNKSNYPKLIGDGIIKYMQAQSAGQKPSEGATRAVNAAVAQDIKKSFAPQVTQDANGKRVVTSYSKGNGYWQATEKTYDRFAQAAKGVMSRDPQVQTDALATIQSLYPTMLPGALTSLETVTKADLAQSTSDLNKLKKDMELISSNLPPDLQNMLAAQQIANTQVATTLARTAAAEGAGSTPEIMTYLKAELMKAQISNLYETAQRGGLDSAAVSLKMKENALDQYKIYQAKLEKATDETEKRDIVDTMNFLSDTYLEGFGKINNPYKGGFLNTGLGAAPKIQLGGVTPTGDNRGSVLGNMLTK